MAELTLKLYADRLCKNPISSIAWKNQVLIKSITGETLTLQNTGKGGEKAEAQVFIRNESHYDFIITEISFPDQRVHVSISTGWLVPQEPIAINIFFIIPKNPTEKDVIKSGQIRIQGYYIYK